MIPLRKRTILNENDLVLHLSLDTDEDGYFANVTRLSKGELNLREWFGKVDTQMKTFKIRKTRPGFPGSKIFATQIAGRIGDDRARIEIRFGLDWFTGVNLVFVPIFCGFFIGNFFNEVIPWAILLVLTAMQIFFVIADFNKTEVAFFNYVSKLPGKRITQVH